MKVENLKLAGLRQAQPSGDFQTFKLTDSQMS